jgi:ABC-2 type transport system ATP-binding protein
MPSILTIDRLSKSYSSVRALNDVSFSVPSKSIFGILGPNGSGKTTLLGIVMDVLQATSGQYVWENETIAPNDVRKKIGTLLETPNFYPYLSAEKN